MKLVACIDVGAWVEKLRDYLMRVGPRTKRKMNWVADIGHGNDTIGPQDGTSRNALYVMIDGLHAKRSLRRTL